MTGIPRFLLIDKVFKIIRSVAPRPSMNDEIVALLERYKWFRNVTFLISEEGG